MPIRLESGYELEDGWNKVRDIGDRMLKACGFGEWEVTLQPAPGRNGAPAEASQDREARDYAIGINVSSRQITIIGLTLDGHLSIAEMIEVYILDTINEIIEAEEGGDPIRTGTPGKSDG